MIYLILFLLTIPYLLSLKISNAETRFGPRYAGEEKNPLPFEAKLLTLTASDGIKIRGWYAPSGQSETIVIVIHGHSLSHKENLEKWRGIYPETASFFFLDLRNHGLSDDAPTTYGYTEAYDVTAAVARFRAEYKKVIVWGTSMGAASAVKAVNYGLNVDGLIIEGLYGTLAEAITLRANGMNIPEFPLVTATLFYYELISGVKLSEMDMSENLKAIEGIPILLLHSRMDEKTPMESFYRLEKALEGKNSTIALFDRGAHEFIYEANSVKYIDMVKGFIEDS